MGLPTPFDLPPDEDAWAAWGFNHAANHYDWISAVEDQKSVKLTQYLLNPIDRNNFGFFLYLNQVSHNQVNQVLGTSGQNLLGYDLQDPDQLNEFFQVHAQEHQRISGALGVG